MAGFLIDLTLSFVLKPLQLNRSWIANLYFLVEFVCISLYLRPRARGTANLYFDIFWLTTAGLYTALTIHVSIYQTNTLGASMLHLVFIAYGIWGLYSILKDLNKLFLDQSEFFWACVAFMLYFSGNFMLFLFIAYLSKGQELLWIYIHCGLNVGYRVLLALSLSRKKT